VERNIKNWDLFNVISVNTTTKAGLSSMKTTDVGVELTYLMQA
jgi:hypothetical protein